MGTRTLKEKLQTGHRDTNDDRDTREIDGPREYNDDGTRDTGDTENINDDRDTQREITDWDTGTQMTTDTQGQHRNTGAQRHK